MVGLGKGSTVVYKFQKVENIFSFCIDIFFRYVEISCLDTKATTTLIRKGGQKFSIIFEVILIRHFLFWNLCK